MIRGIIFDFDGLIIDTEGPVYQSWVEIYHAHNAVLPIDDWTAIIGTSDLEHFDPFTRLEKQIGRAVNRKSLEPQRFGREIEMAEAQPIFPGVEEKISEAKKNGLKLGIASSSSRKWVGGHLERLGLIQFFDVLHTSDDVEHTKPDPALFILALESLQLKPSEAIVFEDSPHGITAANGAGIFSVAIPNPLTRSLNLDHANLRLNSLADLTLSQIIQLAQSN